MSNVASGADIRGVQYFIALTLCMANQLHWKEVSNPDVDCSGLVNVIGITVLIKSRETFHFVNRKVRPSSFAEIL